MKTYVHTKTAMWIFIAASPIITKQRRDQLMLFKQLPDKTKQRIQMMECVQKENAVICIHTQRREWISGAFCQVKEARPKRLYNRCFYLYDVSGKGVQLDLGFYVYMH